MNGCSLNILRGPALADASWQVPADEAIQKWMESVIHGSGLDEASLDTSDVLIWWSHGKQVTEANAERVALRVREGKLGFVALHSRNS